METEEVLKERERIKKLVERVINATISWREKNVKSNKILKSVFERLEKRIIFLIDNPDYKRTGNIKSPDKYNTFKNLEKGNIEFTPPEPEPDEETKTETQTLHGNVFMSSSEDYSSLIPQEPDSFDDEEEILNLEKGFKQKQNKEYFEDEEEDEDNEEYD